MITRSWLGALGGIDSSGRKQAVAHQIETNASTRKNSFLFFVHCSFIRDKSFTIQQGR